MLPQRGGTAEGCLRVHFQELPAPRFIVSRSVGLMKSAHLNLPRLSRSRRHRAPAPAAADRMPRGYGVLVRARLLVPKAMLLKGLMLFLQDNTGVIEKMVIMSQGVLRDSGDAMMSAARGERRLLESLVSPPLKR